MIFAVNILASLSVSGMEINAKIEKKLSAYITNA